VLHGYGVLSRSVMRVGLLSGVVRRISVVIKKRGTREVESRRTISRIKNVEQPKPKAEGGRRRCE
jgi:hypothetical protein